MKKVLIMLLIFVLNSGCFVWIAKDELVMKKKDFKLIEISARRLVISEELYLLSKKNWTRKDMYKYAISTETNTQFLALIGAYKGFFGTELIDFSKQNRQIKEVNKKIEEEMLKLRKEK